MTAYNNMRDKTVKIENLIDVMATKFSDVVYFAEDEDTHDDDEYIPLAAMPNDKLPEISFPSNFGEVSVQIVSLQSPSYFSIHLLNEKGVFVKFCENLNNYYNKLGSDPISPALELPLGSHWCVYYNEVWLRCKVTGNIGKQYSAMHKVKKIHFEMLFVDFGFRDVVALENINSLYEDFRHHPPFSIPCCLAQVYPLSKWKSNPWSRETINFFQAYFFNSNECKATILELNITNTFEVVLELNGLIINEDIVQKGFAESSFIASFTDVAGSLNSDSVTKHSEAVKDDDIIEVAWNPMEDDFIDERNTVHLDDTCAETVLLGFQNKDESYLCKFFSKGLRCPRGETCTWPHIRARTDGLPSGKEIVYYKLQNNLQLPPEGSFLKAVVTMVFSPSNFYINICGLGYDGTTDVMTELKKDLSDAYGRSDCVHEISIPSIGELMVLHKADGNLIGYYRVHVVSVLQLDKFSLIEVYYIDYGIKEQVPQKFLRKLTNQFLRPPAQAVHCYLEDVFPLGEDWQNYDLATTLFRKVTENKIVSAKICTHDQNEDKVGISIMDPDNAENTVSKLIVSAGFGILKAN